MAAKIQQVSMTPALHAYLLENNPESLFLRQLREETAAPVGMQVSPYQAQFLAMLVQISGAKRCIELGVYTGYSSLAVALVLPVDGRLIACEKDATLLEVARRYYERAGVLHKVDMKCDDASKTLNEMITSNKLARMCKKEVEMYDFAFVDAEMSKYQQYLELLLELMRVGGIIVFNNVLRNEPLENPSMQMLRQTGIRDFNKHLMKDKRVSISMVSIGDGITICQKRKICDTAAKRGIFVHSQGQIL